MRIALLGDLMLGRGINEKLMNETAEGLWGDTLPIIRGAQVKIANLECVLTEKTVKNESPKKYYFRSDVKNVAVLKAVEMTVVTLANNHILDYGVEGMEECQRALEKEDIAHVGTGKNAEEARQPLIFEKMGKKVGVISFTDNMPEWSENVYRGKGILSLLKETKKETDLLIVAPHWGNNWGYNPQPEQIELARKMVDAGADIVVGTSPHVFRGIEIYKGKPIFYSLGDFIDDYAVDEIERNDQTFIFILETNSHVATNIYLYPTMVINGGAIMAKGERNAIQQKMASLCAELGTTTKWNDMRGRLEVQLKR